MAESTGARAAECVVLAPSPPLEPPLAQPEPAGRKLAARIVARAQVCLIIHLRQVAPRVAGGGGGNKLGLISRNRTEAPSCWLGERVNPRLLGSKRSRPRLAYGSGLIYAASLSFSPCSLSLQLARSKPQTAGLATT